MRSWFSVRRRLTLSSRRSTHHRAPTNSGRLTGNPEIINRCHVLSLNVSAISMTLGVEYWEQRLSEPMDDE